MQCQICGSTVSVVLEKDINVSCGDYFEGKRLYPETQETARLAECGDCGFATFIELASWSEEDFRKRIYNDEYHLCDPPFRDARPRRLATWLAPLLPGKTVLDYGGGEGLFAQMLIAAGVQAYSFDPFYGQPVLPSGPFDVVTAFEVVEHVPDQRALFEAMKRLAVDGIVIFSTMLKENVTRGDWWYMSPRNGHVCFHSVRSLRLLGEMVGLEIHSISREMHVAGHSAGALDVAKTWTAPPVNETPGFAFSHPWSAMEAVISA